MAFQRPMAIPGVKMADFLRHATTNVRRPDRKEGEELIPMREFRKEIRAKMDQLRIDPEFMSPRLMEVIRKGHYETPEARKIGKIAQQGDVILEIGAGIALLPEPTVSREVEAGTLTATPLVGSSLVRPLGIIHRRGKDPSSTARRFIELLLLEGQDAGGDGARTQGMAQGVLIDGPDEFESDDVGEPALAPERR